jgi:type IV fimbrial biogenesis protein FimT
MKQPYGFTLIELMVTLAIAIILISVAAPSLSSFYDAYRAKSSILVIQQALQYGRNAAISYGVRVTVCPVKLNRCDNDWQNGLTVFTDAGDKNQLDGSDTVILQTSPFNTKDIVSYNRAAIRFKPDGLASGTNGTLRYCPSSATSPYSKAIIVNQAGRVRFSTDESIHCSI